jgi:Uma2 family endonuclease
VKWAELIDGVVHMPSPITEIHSDYHGRMHYWLASYAVASPGCRTAIAGTWLMSADSAPQPDLALRILPECGGQSRMESGYPVGAPELIVEVSLTTSTKDSGAKLKLYERSGVREYIIVGPKAQRVIWRELVNDRYSEIAADGDSLCCSRVFPGLWLDPAALWQGDLAAIAAVVKKGVKTKEHGAFVRQLARIKR